MYDHRSPLHYVIKLQFITVDCLWHRYRNTQPTIPACSKRTNLSDTFLFNNVTKSPLRNTLSKALSPFFDKMLCYLLKSKQSMTATRMLLEAKLKWSWENLTFINLQQHIFEQFSHHRYISNLVVSPCLSFGRGTIKLKPKLEAHNSAATQY